MLRHMCVMKHSRVMQMQTSTSEDKVICVTGDLNSVVRRVYRSM